MIKLKSIHELRQYSKLMDPKYYCQWMFLSLTVFITYTAHIADKVFSTVFRAIKMQLVSVQIAAVNSI